MKTKKRNALFGRYPSCDMLNNALRFIYEGKIDTACAEIVFAIDKAGGYFHEDVVPIVKKVRSYWNKTHKEDEGGKMGYSRYKWLVICDDGSTETIEAETIDEVVSEINDEQPRAIIKMNFC